MYAIVWDTERSLTELRVRTKKHDRSIEQSCGMMSYYMVMGVVRGSGHQCIL